MEPIYQITKGLWHVYGAKVRAETQEKAIEAYQKGRGTAIYDIKGVEIHASSEAEAKARYNRSIGWG